MLHPHSLSSAEGKAKALPGGEVRHTQNQYPNQPRVDHCYTGLCGPLGWLSMAGLKNLTYCYSADALTLIEERQQEGALGPWQPLITALPVGTSKWQLSSKH